MQRNPRAWLWDVQQAAGRIGRFLVGHDLSSYQADEMVRTTVERHSPHLVAEVPHWREAIGFRNVLIHGYAKVDDARAWQVAQLNLPAMAREVDRLPSQADEQRH
jgi:uncharacterized protein with HEPN domain